LSIWQKSEMVFTLKGFNIRVLIKIYNFYKLFNLNILPIDDGKQKIEKWFDYDWRER